MLRYLNNVVTLRLNAGLCNGCGACVNVCPHGVFEIENRKAVIIDMDACMECGACAINCPANAIRVQTGAGCATGILKGTVGKGCECSSPCGVSPAVTGSQSTNCCGSPENAGTNQTGCCGTSTEVTLSDKTSCCGAPEKKPKTGGGKSCCNP